MLTQDQARTWAGADPTLRYTCPAGRCFSSIGPITDCVHAREAARARAFGGVAKGYAGRGAGLRTGADGGAVLVLSDGRAEPSIGDVLAVRTAVRRNQERRLVFGDAVERINATVRTQLSALQAAGVAIPRLLPGQLPAHIERNLDIANRSALGLSPQ